MRAVLMLIAILYVPVLGCFTDEEKRTMGAVLSAIGLVYAIMYDYLYFRKGERNDKG